MLDVPSRPQQEKVQGGSPSVTTAFGPCCLRSCEILPDWPPAEDEFFAVPFLTTVTEFPPHSLRVPTIERLEFLSVMFSFSSSESPNSDFTSLHLPSSPHFYVLICKFPFADSHITRSHS